MQKIIVTTCIVIIAFVFTAYAQKSDKTVDFSGNWLLNEKKSFNRNRDDIEDYTLEIKDSGDKVKINKSYKSGSDKYHSEIILNLDKSGETNVYFKNNKKLNEIESVSRRKKRTIYRTYKRKNTYTHAKVDYDLTYKISEKYIISKDGMKITVKVNQKLVSSTASGSNYHLALGNVATITNSWQNLIFQKNDSN